MTKPCVARHTSAPGPAARPGVEWAGRLLAGYGPARLLAEVSVARVAGMVAESFRDPARWLRPLLSGLESLRLLYPDQDLDSLLAAAWADPWRADRTLADLAEATVRADGAGGPELSRLGLGPKFWYTGNGVPVAWRPLPVGPASPVRPPVTPAGLRLQDGDRLVAAAECLIRAGVGVDEVADLRLGDLGRLVPGEVFVPDLMAEPLAVRLRPPARGGGHRAPWLVLLGYEARITVVAAVLGRYGPDAACRHGGELLLPDGDQHLPTRTTPLAGVVPGPATDLARRPRTLGG